VGRERRRSSGCGKGTSVGRRAVGEGCGRDVCGKEGCGRGARAVEGMSVGRRAGGEGCGRATWLAGLERARLAIARAALAAVSASDVL